MAVSPQAPTTEAIESAISDEEALKEFDESLCERLARVLFDDEGGRRSGEPYRGLRERGVADTLTIARDIDWGRYESKPLEWKRLLLVARYAAAIRRIQHLDTEFTAESLTRALGPSGVSLLWGAAVSQVPLAFIHDACAKIPVLGFNERCANRIRGRQVLDWCGWKTGGRK